MNRHQRKHIIAFMRPCIKKHILRELEREGYVAPSVSDAYYLIDLPHDKIKTLNAPYSFHKYSTNSFREFWRWCVLYIIEPSIKGFNTPNKAIKYLTPQLKKIATSHLLW